MNIRRFVAADMRGALAAVRAELGAEAVMLSSRRVAEGVEVIAAIDYDDSLLATFGGVARYTEPSAAPAGDGHDGDDETTSAEAELSEYQRLASAFAHAERASQAVADKLAALAAGAAVKPVVDAREAGAANGTPLRADRGVAAPRGVGEHRGGIGEPGRGIGEPGGGIGEHGADTGGQGAGLGERGAAAAEHGVVAGELKDLRRLLETQLASLAWNDLQRRAPVRARMLRELAKLGVDAPLAAELADQIPAGLDSQQALRQVVRLLGERLPLVPSDMADSGGVFALVGPTGVGKTTTIAKIAARAVLRHGVDSVGLISTDTYRIGARQQLSNYARILRAPLQVAENAEELGRLLDGFARKKLVLVDTAGMSQRDVRLASQFATLRAEGQRVRTVLVLSAAADRGCLTQAVNVFKQAQPESLIVTKLDEATALGGVLSLALASALPIAYLADGQRVPEDLHLAAPKRFWLLHNAVKLTMQLQRVPDEDALAETFGHMELAANA